MLKLLSDQSAVLDVDDFYIVEKTSGMDELIFNMSIYDENYPHVLEEAIIEYEQPYLVKAIDAGADTAKVKCQIDLDALRADMHVNYSNNSNTLYNTVSAVLPSGWTFLDNSGSTIRRTIEGNYTPLEIITECAETYGVVFRFDVKNKIVRAYTLKDFQPIGSFASRELNLTEINFKGKSTDFYTRLYAYGKDGLSFASINDGKPYVDFNDYSDKVISAYWEDDRYTDAQSLLEAAQEAVKTGGTPQRSYECSVYDLAATNPEMYGWQDFSLFSVVRLIDDIKKISVNYQVVEREIYPYYPEKNVVTLSTTTPKIQNTVKNIKTEIENPNSNFRQNMQALINSMAASIAGFDGGNLVITQNTEGQPNGLMIMDTADQSTAKKVLYFNLNGLAYSDNGVNGPFNAVWSFEQGGFIADWIVAGTILANIIHGGTLTLGGSGNGNGILSLRNANDAEIVRLDLNGIKITSGDLGGWNINSQAIYHDVTASDGTIYRVYFQPPLQSAPDKTWVLSCQKSTDGGDTFTGNFVLYSDGSAKFGNTTINSDGSAKFGNTTIDSDGNATFGPANGRRWRLSQNGLLAYSDSTTIEGGLYFRSINDTVLSVDSILNKEGWSGDIAVGSITVHVISGVITGIS